MISNGISLVYFGEFNHQVTKMFTSMSESEMERNSEQRMTRRRVYHTMIETLQNLNKHSDELSDKGNVGRGLFFIGKKDKVYYIITTNRIKKAKIPSLRAAIEVVSHSSRAELNQMYKDQLKEGEISKKGGAGLGLIDIARKTKQNIDYEFLPLDDEYYYFIFKVEIDTEKV